MTASDRNRIVGWLGPGLLVAATGVGAGDLATGAIAGSKLGLAILWAIPLGAACKWLLSEALTRYQLATGQTVLEGALTHLPPSVRWLFLLYLLAWSWFVGSALVNACGIAFAALWPGVFGEAHADKVGFGIAASALGWIAARSGGFARFEKIMGACIAVMFVTTITTAVWLGPDLGAFARGSLWPTIPTIEGAPGEGLTWALALLGGVGGTLTVICYGYWLRESNRTDLSALRGCRIDLLVGYGATALFGMAMVVIGSRLAEIEGQRGASLMVALGDELRRSVGETARILFLVGGVAAVFSSLLGVWQSVPYVFADFWRLARDRGESSKLPVDTRSRSYRWFALALATVPLLGLQLKFVAVQKAYAVVGAAFLPLLAATLLHLAGRKGPIPPTARNPAWATIGLWLTLVLFVAYGIARL